MLPRILLVDDDVELTRMLTEYLEGEGFAIDSVHDGRSALSKAREGYDVIVLDVMLPQLNGLDTLRELRRDDDTPVLMLTARGDDLDTVVGLELGADDYLPKPCNPRVLVARLRALLRRRRGDERESAALVVGDLRLEPGTRAVTVAGQAAPLTGAEFNVLEQLLRYAGSVVDKDALAEAALGRRLAPYERAIDMHISNLRRKLGPLPSGASRIVTVRGAGYQYVQD